MKGIEHFREAERFLAHAELQREDWDISPEVLVAYAQAHAILSASVALSNLVTVWGDIAAMMRADSELADAEPPRAEPLVTCDQSGESGLLRCGLPVGHDGQHADKNDLGTIRWTQDQDAAMTFEKPTCNAGPGDDGPERCGLAIGHDGLHEHDAGGGLIVSWSTPAEMAAVSPTPFYESTATDMNMEMPR